MKKDTYAPLTLGNMREPTDVERLLLRIRPAAERMLRDMCVWLTSADPNERRRGEEVLKKLAAHLARVAQRRLQEQLGAQEGRQIRLDAGQRKARIVEALLGEGADPLEIVSARQLRRIKSRKKT